MATVKHARVLSAQMIGEDTRLLDLAATEPLGFFGGQYIIIDSGLVLDSGKAVKRAYSILTPDAQQERFQLAVKRIPGGPCSEYVHQLRRDAEIRFSGPWGKLEPHSAGGASLVLATDTGVSAAIALVQSARFEPLLKGCIFIWLRTAAGYFLPDDFVRERVPRACSEVRIDVIPPAGHLDRIQHARVTVARVLERVRFEQAFISGDGAVNYALLADLVAAGLAVTRDNVESFFNMPKKST